MNQENVIIEAVNLTKDFGRGNGIFNLNFKIEKGEMVGFVGTNGSGKSTTIRTIVGFLKPTNGYSKVFGYDSWKDSHQFIKDIGYVPGEIAFPDLNSGFDFLNSQRELLKLDDLMRANEMIKLLQLDLSANLKRMSKGMKQKTALVAALMADPQLLILDEPTTGLDPLMRIHFMETIKNEHLKGKTILMSSQSFEELERTCDKVIFILNGHMVTMANMDEIKKRPYRTLKIEFIHLKDYHLFKDLPYKIIRTQDIYMQVTIEIHMDEINRLMHDLKDYELKFISEIPYTLASHFKRVALNNLKGENNV